MKHPWFSTIYEILQYKLDDFKYKAKEVLAELVVDYQKAGSLTKFIAIRKGMSGLEKELLKSQKVMCYEPYNLGKFKNSLN